MTTKSMDKSAWAEDIEQFLYLLDHDKKKTRSFEKLNFKIINSVPLSSIKLGFYKNFQPKYTLFNIYIYIYIYAPIIDEWVSIVFVHVLLMVHNNFSFPIFCFFVALSVNMKTCKIERNCYCEADDHLSDWNCFIFSDVMMFTLWQKLRSLFI